VDGKASCKRQALGKDASESQPCTKTPPKKRNPASKRAGATRFCHAHPHPVADLFFSVRKTRNSFSKIYW
jgi:hypothetical protein